jgi:hypothetical protein
MKKPQTIRTEWRKSRRSGDGGNCVEVADLVQEVAVRDSKDPEGSRLRLSPTGWATLAWHIKSGNLDL